MRAINLIAWFVVGFVLATGYLHADFTTPTTSVQGSKMQAMIRCDNSNSISGQGSGVSPISWDDTGVTCAAGDYSTPFDARGYDHVCIMFHEYNITGTGEAKLWNCQDVGTPQEHPGGTPTSGDPEPLCVDLTLTVFAGGGGPLDGVTVAEACLSNYPLAFLVGEVEACVGDCDSTMTVRVSR